MRAGSEVDEYNVNKFPERNCSIRTVTGNLSDVEVARVFSECGFNPATDFKCFQKVSAGIITVIFLSFITH